MAQTIALKGPFITKEAEADAALSPGHAVEVDSNGEVKKQATAGSVGPKAFALEQEHLGKTTTDAYKAAERVQYGIFYPGSEVLARVSASAPAIVVGDELAFHSDGTMRKKTGSNAVVAIAAEAVDNSGNANSEAFIKIEII